MNHRLEQQKNSSNGVQSKPRWALIAFLAIAVYFLVMEHKAHLSGLLYYLPYLLLLACPLLHMFMHKGHGHHSGTRPDTQREGEKK